MYLYAPSTYFYVLICIKYKQVYTYTSWNITVVRHSMDQLLSMATSVGYWIPVSQARLKLLSESTTDSTINWSSSTSWDPGCILISLRSVSYVWRYPARAWKRRMHMDTSLLLVRFATVLIFWHIGYGRADKQAHTQYVPVFTKFVLVCTKNEWVHTTTLPLELDKRCYLSFPTAKSHGPCAECCESSQNSTFPFRLSCLAGSLVGCPGDPQPFVAALGGLPLKCWTGK